MAQLTKRHLLVDGAHWAANVAITKKTSFSGTLRSLREAEIKGFLCQYVMAESPYLRLDTGVGRSKQLVIVLNQMPPRLMSRRSNVKET
jgi:hypothetical protein